jgi:hypothetical protein
MENPPDNRSFIWIIDDTDGIIYVNEDWLAFARENGAPDLSAALVLNKPLWRFIQGQETIYLYRQLLGKLRTGMAPVKLPFRCDSPDCRRFMEMELSLLTDDPIQFLARLIRQEYRPPVDLLDVSREGSGEFLRVCSWCKKIFITGRGWGEIEEAIRALKLFGSLPLPHITHSICNSCYHLVRQELALESDAGINRS